MKKDKTVLIRINSFHKDAIEVQGMSAQKIIDDYVKRHVEGNKEYFRCMICDEPSLEGRMVPLDDDTDVKVCNNCLDKLGGYDDQNS